MNVRLAVRNTALDGLHVVATRRLGDSRGYFERLFCSEELAAAGWTRPIAQVNNSLTEAAGVVRGLHYQDPPHAEMKLIRCVEGAAFDVAVDLRPGSPTHGRWHAETLSEDNGLGLLVPEGMAHGFQSLTQRCRLVYLHTAAFVPESQGGVHPLDPTLAIPWPIAVRTLSERDALLPFLKP